MAVQQIGQESSPTAMLVGPAGTQAPKATVPEVLQILCEQSISAAGRKAVGIAIAAVPGALQRLMTLMQVRQAHLACQCRQLIHASKARIPYTLRCWQTVPARLRLQVLRMRQCKKRYGQ